MERTGKSADLGLLISTGNQGGVRGGIGERKSLRGRPNTDGPASARVRGIRPLGRLKGEGRKVKVILLPVRVRIKARMKGCHGNGKFGQGNEGGAAKSRFTITKEKHLGTSRGNQKVPAAT